MKNILNFIALLLVVSLFCACSCNPIQPVLLITVKDMFLFGIVYLIAVLILALYLGSDSDRKFWFWFIIGLIFVPIPIIAALIKGLSK